MLASIRLVLFALLMTILGFWQGWDIAPMLAGWFIVIPLHRLELNLQMGWDVWYMGTTARYDRFWNWFAGPIGASAGKLATAMELFAYAAINLMAVMI